jgi:hypothetical protein
MRNVSNKLSAMLCVVSVLSPAGLASAAPSRVWMTEEAMRAAFIGKTLQGHYVDGLAWSETYSEDGRLDYREALRRGRGSWHFQGRRVFCTFYDPGHGLSGGCWTALQVSRNCYEFYSAEWLLPEENEAAPGPLRTWIARGWRQGEPSSCDEPTA